MLIAKMRLLCILVWTLSMLIAVNSENKTHIESLNNPIYSLSLKKIEKGAFCLAIARIPVQYFVQVIECLSQRKIKWWSIARILRIKGDPVICLVHCRVLGYINEIQYERSTMTFFQYNKEKLNGHNSIVNTHDNLTQQGRTVCLQDVTQSKGQRIADMICKNLGYLDYIKSGFFIERTVNSRGQLKNEFCDGCDHDKNNVKSHSCYIVAFTCRKLPPLHLPVEIEFENNMNPVLSISPTERPTVNDEVTLNCSVTYPMSMRLIPRLVRVTYNRSIINNLEWASGGNGIKYSFFNGMNTVQVGYKFTVKWNEKNDIFVCVAEDLLSGITKQNEILLKYMILSDKSPKITMFVQGTMVNDSFYGSSNVMSLSNMYVKATSLECEADKVASITQYMMWNYTSIGGQFNFIANDSKNLLLNNVEKRLPVCCIVKQQYRNEIKIEETCTLENGHSPQPKTQVYFSGNESETITCPRNTSLLITEVYMSSSQERLNNCTSIEIIDFFKHERCEINNRCSGVFSLPGFIKDMLKTTLPKSCFEGEDMILKFVYYCLPI